MEPICWSAIFDRIHRRPPGSLTPNARLVLQRRYLLKDAAGRPIEDPPAMFARVADNIAEAEVRLGCSDLRDAARGAFLSAMEGLDFLPNSPTLMNAGRQLQQLAACFVLPVEDSIEGIFDAVKAAALIHQSGGGTGFSFSRLRPSGDMVSTSRGQASGPISFMRVFNEATRAISQGGFRRGANMGILRIDHPDIRDFIRCKEAEGAFENFNLSVAVTNDFMERLERNESMPLVNPRDGGQRGSVSAAELWAEIVRHAWANGEPGLFFVDRANADQPTPALGPIESTNPCGEQPLLPHEACNLGSVNLSHFAADRDIDWPALRDTVHLAVRFLDDAIEMSRYPLAAIDATVRGNRKIGLGVMGWADLLIELGIPYDSDRALETARRVMAFIQAEGRRASQHLAVERGPFPNHSRSLFAGGPAQRNATITTVAPTGTLSLIAGCSAGIEPIFSIATERNVLGGERLLEVQPAFARIARQRGFYSDDLLERMASGDPDALARVPEDVLRLFATAHQVAPQWHVRMQAAFQEHVDNAVSKTVNLPHAARPADVDRVYRLAWQLGCKGITIYRDASRQEQVLLKSNGRSLVCRECLVEDDARMCPECGGPLVHESGCHVCHGCGYTLC